MNYSLFSKSLKKIAFQDQSLNNIPLETILENIPIVDELKSIGKGVPVLIRAELDLPIKNNEIADKSRIFSCLKTIRYCLEKGCIVILFGHIGREKTISLNKVKDVFSSELEKPIVFIQNWLDETNDKLNDNFVTIVNNAEPSTIFMLENTRQYNIERALWKVKETDFKKISQKMFSICQDFRNRISKVEINEAISASNIDFSSTAIPLLMDETALGFFISDEMKKHVLNARNSSLVIFSGLKINKLDDLERIVDRGGRLELIIAGGSLAMAFLKASAQCNNQFFSIGLAESDNTLKSYIPKERIEQAIEIISKCQKSNIEIVLPVDFILDNGKASEFIPEERIQYDIGPKTNELFARKINDFIDKKSKGVDLCSVYYNGVFGKFEDPLFEGGTKSFIPLLKKMTLAGIRTYVGGGEGRLALSRFGSIEDVTHAFTCGGTVLKSLTNYHIAYLKSMYLQNCNKK